MNKSFQKKKKATEKKIFEWRCFLRILRFAVSMAVFIVALVFIGFYLFLFSKSLFDIVVGYADAKIAQEQTGYYADAKAILLDIEKSVWVVDEQIGNIEENMALTTEEKIQLNSELKKLEENSILLKRNFDGYFNDFSIQAYPRSSSETASFVYETGNFAMAIDRFVRALELNLFLAQRYREDQIELILEDYYDVIWYLGEFGMIEA